MTIDMTNNRVPYGLLTDEEKAALHGHEKAGGAFEYWCGIWDQIEPSWLRSMVYRTVPLPKTQDVIAWEKLPDWVEWVARDEDGSVWCYRLEPDSGDGVWSRSTGMQRRIDDFPGIVLQIGTCDWKDSKQRRPQVRDGGHGDE
jgi:hypothetical protein